MTAHADWTVSRPTRCCAATGRPLVEGDACYSVLLEEDDRFVRRDYCEDAWSDVPREGVFSYWKTRIPDAAEADRRRLVFDVEVFLRFYADLEGAREPSKVLFRGVVALMLARKRALRLDGVDRRASGNVLLVYDRRRDRRDEIPVPEGSSDEIAAVERELTELLEM